MADTIKVDAASGDDPLGWRAELRLSLQAPELDLVESEFSPPDGPSIAACHAAYAVARSLGWCRLTGVDPEDLDGTLPAPLAASAARELAARCQAWAADARELGSRFDTTPSGHEAEELVLDMLEARMEAWACWLALDEAYWSALEEEDAGIEPLRAATEATGVAYDDFDNELQPQVPLLSLAAGTRMLENWRSLLAKEYRELLPWWLDGTLEDVAGQIQQEAQDAAPSPAAWRRLRESLVKHSLSRKAPEILAMAPWLPRPASALLAAAAPDREIGPPAFHTFLSPDRTVETCLIVPDRAMGDDEELRLTFRSPRDQEPVLDLVGQSAWLASVRSVIGPGAVATFALRDLRAAGKKLSLAVGHEDSLVTYTLETG